MTTILITGVTGFIGSNLVSYFNDNVAVKLYGHTRNVVAAKEKLKDFKIDILSEYTSTSIDALNIDCIIHLAGIAHDLSNKYVDADYYKVNFEDTAKLYDEFLKSKAGTFIYFSSIKAAVDSINNSFDENIQPNPVTPYGKSKLKAEEYIKAHSTAEKKYYILRPCMIHGPGNKGNLNLLYKFVKSGIPYPLGAFQNKRSFLNVDNLNFIIDKLLHSTAESGIYNLSDEGLLSTNEVVSIIASTLGKKARVWNLPMRPINFFFTVGGKKKMLSKLTESMEVSNLKIISAIGQSLPVSIDEGLRKTIRSFHE
ncbi:MAG TPA: NAD-dependent epimerase/dehydratase family protein [Cyclobacteriaceae bacterium]